MPALGNAIDLYIKEVNRIHELLDGAGVPRTADQLPMSAAQRVEEALRLFRVWQRIERDAIDPAGKLI